MNRRMHLPFAVGLALLTFGCRSDTVSPPFSGPMFAVSDGAHEGNPHFFFLPPLFKMPAVNPGTFNPNLAPEVQVCDLGPHLDFPPARDCLPGVDLVAHFAPGTATVSTTDELYQVNWNTDASTLLLTNDYRIRVLVGGELLGFADVDPVIGKDLKNVQTGEYIALLDGRTLPIKFRIENGALCDADAEACAAATIDLATGGGVELTIVENGQVEEIVRLDIPANTEATFGGAAVTEVTFNVEECDGIDVDLPLFGKCLRVTTFFDIAEGIPSSGELLLTNPALVSLCLLEPGLPHEIEDLITLHQQDGFLIQALPHARPNCETIGAAELGPSGFASGGWRWLTETAARLLSPQPLYASSRAMVINLGGGGETNRFGSDCSSGGAASARMLLVECPPPSAIAPQLAAAATGAAPQTVSDFQFARPAKMAYLNPDDVRRTIAEGSSLPTAVKVTDWNDAPVPGATVTFTVPGIEGPGTVLGTAISNADGVAEISWPIAEGLNSLVASGRGIAAQNNYPDATVRPFMPDITQPFPSDPACTPDVACQQPVTVLRGEVPFTATGVAAATAGLYLIRDSDDMLRRLDPGTLAITDIGSLGIDYAFGDCAWNARTNTMYVVEVRSTNTLYTVNLSTGAATAVGVHGIVDMFAIGFHPPTGELYGASAAGNLYRLNLTTGAPTLVGATGLVSDGSSGGSVNGLAWDPARSQFVALVSNVGGGALYSLNLATAAPTLLAASPGIDNAGFTYDAAIDRFWAADFKGGIFQYNPAAGYERTTILAEQGIHTCAALVP